MKNNKRINCAFFGLLALVLALMGLWSSQNLFLQLVPTAHATGAPYKLTGKVVRVSDGDTINLLIDNKQERIRLASIDAPETAHGSSQPGQPFGEASRKNLANYVAGKTIAVT
jgi:endonuclease YncB( thermonuclease family)